MHRNLMLIGASGHGKVVTDIAKCTGRYESIAFLDDDLSLQDSMGFPVVGGSGDAYQYVASCELFVAIGNAETRKRLMEQLQAMGAEVPVLIHPKAVIGANVSIGAGSVIMAGAVINPDTRIGQGCIVNTCASIDHDCVIRDYVHVSVGAHLAGAVSVGNNTWVGAGAVIKNNVDLCSNCMVGMGAVVVKNIGMPGTYIGVPAKEVDNMSKKLQENVWGGKTLSRKGMLVVSSVLCTR